MPLVKHIALIVLLSASVAGSANSTAINKADTLAVKMGYDSSFLNCEYVFDFKDSSTLISSTDSIVYWEWDFGDGSVHPRIPNPTHKYNTYGRFTIKLVVMLSNGVKDSTTKNLYLPGPFADFAFTDPYQGLDTVTICQWQELSIENTSTGELIDQENDVVWWGDGEVTSPGMSWDVAKHTYRYSGTFMLTLRVYAKMHGTNTTCMSSYPHYDESRRTRIQKVVVVREAPPVGLEIGRSPTYRYHPTGFKPLFDSTLNAERLLFYGDGDSSSVMNGDTLIIHHYQTSNTYDVRFIATYETKDQQQRKCADTFSTQINVLHDSLNAVEPIALRCDIYPVPSTGLLNIKWSQGVSRIEVFNAAGSLVYSEEVLKGAQATQLDLNDLPGGSYFVKISGANGGFVLKQILLN